MYETFYGLRERPFDLTPNPRFLMLTGKHREALSNLEYGLTSRRGLTLLVGDAGTGKTTLVRMVIQELQQKGASIAYLNNPTLSRSEFIEFLSASFSLNHGSSGSKTKLLAELVKLLEERHRTNSLTGLVIDEAQVLPDELLEEVRLLANIETASEKLMPIVLAGQPELADRLNQPSLRQLKQRVALRCELAALDGRETAEYIAGRIRTAGGNSVVVFTRQAVDLIYQRSGGIPRLISVICDNALISGFAADRRPITRDIVEEVCRDFDLPTTGQSAGVPALRPVSAPVKSVPDRATKTGGAPAAPEPGHRSLFEHFSVRRRFSIF